MSSLCAQLGLLKIDEHGTAQTAADKISEDHPKFRDISHLTKWLEDVEDQCQDMFTIREEYGQAQVDILFKRICRNVEVMQDDWRRLSCALRHKTIVHMLQNIELGDCFSKAEKDTYLGQVQLLLPRLSPTMTQEEAHHIVVSLKGRGPSLITCHTIAFQAVTVLYEELFDAAIDKLEKIIDSHRDQSPSESQQSIKSDAHQLPICSETPETHHQSTQGKPTHKNARYVLSDLQRDMRLATLELAKRHAARSLISDRWASQQISSSVERQLVTVTEAGKTFYRHNEDCSTGDIDTAQVRIPETEILEPSKYSYVTMQQRKMARLARQVSLLSLNKGSEFLAFALSFAGLHARVFASSFITFIYNISRST